MTAFARVKEWDHRRKNCVVMAALDAAIQDQDNAFSMAVDGRVKPGHDSGFAGHSMTNVPQMRIA